MQRDSIQAPPGNPERAMAWLLALVLAVAFGVRMWMALTLPRYFDDHYIFNNIETFLNGSLRPRHSYYGSLSYLPQALFLALCDFLHSRTGWEALAVRGTQVEGFTRGAFLIMRTFVIGYALLSIVIVYRAGRRLFSPVVGLAAAAVLAAYPQHVRSAIQLKPDMMALMFTVLTLHWTAAAAQSPRLSRFLRAGVGVGLATAAKYIGAASALPLTLWALWAGRRERRLWGRLVLAGLASIVTFLALNPFIGTVLHFGTRLVGFYGQRAKQEESGHLLVVRGELDFLSFQHGWLLGPFLLLGLALLVYRLVSRREESVPALLSLSLCLGYPVVYALGMTLFRTHNLLPALGGTALVCAYAMVWCGRWLLARGAVARLPAAALLVGAVPGLLLLARPFLYTYSRVVPGIWTVAEHTLRMELPQPQIRHVAYEPATNRLGLAKGAQHAALTAVPSLAALPPSELDFTDAEVFPLSRESGPQGAFYQGRRKGVGPGCAIEIHARPFRSQGQPMVLLVHPWALAGDPVPADLQRDGAPGALAAPLPPGLFTPGDVLSIEITWPEADNSEVGAVQVGGKPLPLIYAGRRAQRLRYLTPRFQYEAGEAEIRLSASPQAHPKSFRLQIWRWARGACRNQGPA